MDHEFDLHQLEQYLAGECSLEDAQAIEQWVRADPARQHLLDALRAVWAAPPRVPGFDVHAFIARVAARTYAPSRQAPVRELAFPPRSTGGFLRTQYVAHWWHRPWARAAALVVLVLTGLGLWYRAPWRALAASHGPTSLAYREVATARGERAEITLKDGTRVILGPESRLRTPTHYGEPAREVDLEGEAFFDVHHDATAPFRVRTGGIVTEDIGTAFAIRAYAGDSALRVVVAEGSVAVAPRAMSPTIPHGVDTTRLVLRAHDLVRVTHDGAMHPEHGVVLDRYLGWTEGRLVFRNTPLRQVIPELARWYDLDIAPVDSAVGARLVTATYTTTESATLALTAIARSLDLTVERQGRAVRFRP
jgi:ferric-dicitrate binding protein FerR (iron transport regulator)